MPENFLDEQTSEHDLLINQVMDKYLASLDQDRPLLESELVAEFPQLRTELHKLFSAMSALGRLASTENATNLAEPVCFGDWTLLRVLGRGGTGVVFEALDKQGSTVAIKIFARRLDEQGLARFNRELETLQKLQHPAIAKYLEHGLIDGVQFIVFEHVDGCSLDQLLRAIRQGETHGIASLQSQADQYPDKNYTRAALSFIATIAEALDASHQLGIVHRDIKPSNILINKQGHGFLTDFGLAMALDTKSKVTQSGLVVGTLGYISPEVAAGGRADQRSDLYSLGIVALEMLTLAAPLSLTASLPWAAAETPLKPGAYNLHLPASAETVLRKLISTNPEFRPASALEVAKTLRASVEAMSQRTPIMRKATSWIAAGIFVLVATWLIAHYVPGESKRKDNLAKGTSLTDTSLEDTSLKDTESTNAVAQPPVGPTANSRSTILDAIDPEVLKIPRSELLKSVPSSQLNIAEGDVEMSFRFEAQNSDNQPIARVRKGEEFLLALVCNAKVKIDDRWRQSIMFACRVAAMAEAGYLESTGAPKVHRVYIQNDKFMASNDGLVFGPFALQMNDLTTSSLDLDNDFFGGEVQVAAILPMRAIQSGRITIKPFLPQSKAGERNLVRHAARPLFDKELITQPFILEIFDQ